MQPSCASDFSGTYLLKNLVAEIKVRLKAKGQVYLVYIQEDLSGNSLAELHEFWEMHGLSESALNKCQFVEKRYAELRGWMDNGIDEDEIVSTVQELRACKVWDSRNLPDGRLEELSEDGSQLLSPLFLSYELETSPLAKLATIDICGGGRDFCLREVELWLESRGAQYNRVEHLVY